MFGILLSSPVLAGEINVYTTREKGLIEPLLEGFTKATGTHVNVVYLKDGLAERVAAEGENSPADVMMAADAGNLVELAERGLTQPVVSQVLQDAIPESLRDKNANWFALSWRARVIYAAKDMDLSAMTYEDLAGSKWQGKICIRSGQHPYNTALTAAYIAHHGAQETEAWLTALHGNLARSAAGGDRDVAKDILGGICTIGVANSYYVGLMRSGKGGPEQIPWGEAIKVILPTFKDGGTHINISGAAVAKFAPNTSDAVKFLEFLVSDEAQKLYASANYEYPVKAGISADPIIQSFGDVKIDPIAMTEINTHRKEASELIDKVGFDN